jgi:hypothetical protein
VALGRALTPCPASKRDTKPQNGLAAELPVALASRWLTPRSSLPNINICYPQTSEAHLLLNRCRRGLILRSLLSRLLVRQDCCNGRGFPSPFAISLNWFIQRPHASLSNLTVSVTSRNTLTSSPFRHRGKSHAVIANQALAPGAFLC